MNIKVRILSLCISVLMLAGCASSASSSISQVSSEAAESKSSSAVSSMISSQTSSTATQSVSQKTSSVQTSNKSSSSTVTSQAVSQTAVSQAIVSQAIVSQTVASQAISSQAVSTLATVTSSTSTSQEDITTFLKTNYPKVTIYFKYIIGPPTYITSTNFVINYFVLKNTSPSIPYDYEIQLANCSYAFNDILKGTYTKEERLLIKKGFVSFMENLAKILISKYPGIKFYGRFYDSAEFRISNVMANPYNNNSAKQNLINNINQNPSPSYLCWQNYKTSETGPNDYQSTPVGDFMWINDNEAELMIK